MHVAAVSQPLAYLPVGIIHRRPTTDPVAPVRSQRANTAQTGTPTTVDDAGPKLLVDLSLMAPRPTDQPSAAMTVQSQATERTGECSTCARRRYQDGSDDPSVSFQTPTHVSPGQAEVMVRVHEQEHVQHERTKAAREGKQVETHVSIHYSICPECGRVYCSGGTTHVTTREPVQQGEPGAASELPSFDQLA